jgi:hypothetical protein
MAGTSGISRRAGRSHLSAVCVSLDLASHSAVFDSTRTLADVLYCTEILGLSAQQLIVLWALGLLIEMFRQCGS